MFREISAICAVVMLAALPAAANPTVRINLGPGGQEANGYSPASDISANGRWVAFSSHATNLVAGPPALDEDVYLRDLQTQRIELVSFGPGGARGNHYSSSAKLSADGRFVCFPSYASNLVPGDTNRQTDIFLRDRRLGTLSRINVDSRGRQAQGITFDCDISASGRYVVFDSDAGNLVPGDTNHEFDVFLFDRVAGTISRVSLGVGGQQARGGFCFEPSLSDDGRFLAFASAADNMVERRFAGRSNIIVRDLKTGRNTLASRGTDGGPIDFGASDPAISGDGRFVAFDSNSTNLVPGDTNENDDVFVFDRKTGRTERVSVASDGAQADSSSLFPRISGDGRFVLFTSYADNLVPGDTNGTYDVFVHDRATHTTARVSVDSHGRQADGPSQDNIAIAHDGSFVVFSSGADNLVPNDRNDNWDVFLHRGPPLAGH